MPKLDKFPVYAVSYDPSAKHGFGVKMFSMLEPFLILMLFLGRISPKSIQGYIYW